MELQFSYALLNRKMLCELIEVNGEAYNCANNNCANKLESNYPGYTVIKIGIILHYTKSEALP